ncbi:MAG: hypothetical protein AMXMBFR84_30920 [Candidatus Hydrogenedentota bacterium]
MSEQATTKPRIETGLAILAGFALLKLTIHLTYNRWYGFHQDEFYFLACGNHLSFGYVDHPPLVPWIARIAQETIGDSLPAVRFASAVFGAAGLFLTGLTARRLGGGAFAQAIACLAYLIAPVYLRSGNILSIPSFEPFYWILCCYLIVCIVQDNNPKLWLWVGVVAGLGLMNKHTMAFFGVGLAAGIVLTPLRQHLKSPYLWGGGAIAFLIFLPNLIWQYMNDWPTLEFIRQLNAGTMSKISLPEFLIGQILYLHPANVFVWISGLIFFLFTQAGRPFRVFGWIYVVVFLLLVVAKSKIYYLAPAYAILFAGGAVALECWLRNKPWRMLRPVLAAVMVIVGGAFAALSLPIMNINATDRYIQVITMGAIKNAFEVTGDLHAMFGWKEMVDGVAQAYAKLTPEEKEKAFLYGRSYSFAGAIDYYGPELGLPKAYSSHLTYWMWGPPSDDKTIMIAAGVSPERLKESFESVEVVCTVNPEHGLRSLRNQPIAICRNSHYVPSKYWPMIRSW